MLGEELEGNWNLKLTTEFHMTNDNDLLNRECQGFLLYEGKMIHQFTHKWAQYDHNAQNWIPAFSASDVGPRLCSSEKSNDFTQDEMPTPQYWIDEQTGRRKLLGRQKDQGQLMGYDFYRFGHRRIAASTNERALIATVIPPMSFCEINCTVNIPIEYEDGDIKRNISYAELCFLVSVFNSFCLDYIMRQKFTTTLNMFYIYQLPVPRLTDGDRHFDQIVPRAARLIYVSQIFDDFWIEIFGTDLANGYGAIELARRSQLRAEIDALVADLYGLTFDDFRYILSTFPLLDRSQPPLPGEEKSTITADHALLELYKLRNISPPAGLEDRFMRASEIGAIGYIPLWRGELEETGENEDMDEESEEKDE